jgi:pimeloyl-ACP methyl ester carboxylesterase
MSYYVAGSGPPLLLIHSINAAASAYEVRPLFEHYRHTRRVYAPDLPGFGFSDRSPRDYTPRLYADAIMQMLDTVAEETGEQAPDALALSLSSEFLARAASEHPGRFRTLSLVTPTGFDAGTEGYAPPGSTRGTPWLQRILAFPLWSRAFFDLLNTRPSQRYFLKKTFGSYDSIDEGLLAYDYATAHQKDAQHAPYAFLSGTLFSADIHRIYDELTMPVWLGYGMHDEFTRFDGITRIIGHDNWLVQPFTTGGLPHFEQFEAFSAAYDAFLSGATTP